MYTINVILAVITIISFIITITTFVKTEIKKANERANIQILKERNAALQKSLARLFTTADAIVQLGKADNTDVSNLQQIARVLRHEIYSILEDSKWNSDELAKWRFGTIMESAHSPRKSAAEKKHPFEIKNDKVDDNKITP